MECGLRQQKLGLVSKLELVCFDICQRSGIGG